MMNASRSFLLLGENGEFLRWVGTLYRFERKFEAETWADDYWRVCQECQTPDADEFSDELKDYYKTLKTTQFTRAV